MEMTSVIQIGNLPEILSIFIETKKVMTDFST